MSRISGYPSRPPSRPPSEQLCDLHVYKVPIELWRAPLNNILNQSVTDTISLGIIRVPPDTALVDLRPEINKQLEELAPKDYVFLRSVGRSITRLKTKQEYHLKAKHFLPPVHYAPELYILEATPELVDALAISDRSSQSPGSLRRGSPGGRSFRDRDRDSYRSYRDRNGYAGEPGRSREQRVPDPSPYQQHYSPLPRIHPSSPAHSRQGSPSPTHPHHHPHYSDPRGYADPRASQNQSHPQRGYFDSRQQPQAYSDPHQSPPYSDPSRPPPFSDSSRPPPFSDSQASTDTNQSGHPPNQHPEGRGRDGGEVGYEQGNRPREFKQAETERPQSPRTGKQIDEAYRSAVPPHSPTQVGRSRGESPERKGAAGQTYRGPQREAADAQPSTEDSGVAGLTPEDHYKHNRDKENFYDNLNSKSRDLHGRLDRDRLHLDDEDDDSGRRLRDLEDGALMDSERWHNQQNQRRRQANADHRYRSEQERRTMEEEEEEKRRRAEEEAARLKGEEDLNRFPSPPTLRMSQSPDIERDTESAKQRRKEEKERLAEELQKVRQDRQLTEKDREELVKKAKLLQTKTQNRRNQARDVWKKRYFEEKKKTAPLEEQTNRLQEELEGLHRKLMATLEGPREKNLKMGDARPSQKNNYVIQCTKLQHDIDDLKRRVENAKMKLTAEMKLRAQAESELRAVRSEAVQKKIHMRGQPFNQVY